MEAAAAGASEGSVFLAEKQTAGRGRGNNQWHSAESAGIYCSVILRPALPPSEVLVLSLAAGLAVRSAVQEINPRLTTSYIGLRQLARTNLAETWLRLFQGETVDDLDWHADRVIEFDCEGRTGG